MMVLYECFSYPNGLMTIIIYGGEMQLNLLDFFPSSCLNNQLFPIQKISWLFLITIPFLCTKALVWNSFPEYSCSYFLQISFPSQNRQKKYSHFNIRLKRSISQKNPTVIWAYFIHILWKCLSIQIKTKKWSGKWGKTILSF